MKIFKTTLLLMCIAFLTALASCSKDSTANNIIGKWKCTVDNYTDNGNDFGHDSFVGSIWVFKDGGVLKMGNETTTYTMDGNNIVIAGGLSSGTVTKLTGSTLILDLQYAMSVGDNPYPTDHLEFARQ